MDADVHMLSELVVYALRPKYFVCGLLITSIIIVCEMLVRLYLSFIANDKSCAEIVLKKSACK